MLGNQDQGLRCRLPLRSLMLGLWQLGDVGAGILERDNLTATGQIDRIFERTLSAAINLHSRNSCVSDSHQTVPSIITETGE
jgi:hypothetical protein